MDANNTYLTNYPITIPIFITIKGYSRRCPGKNKKLLPYTYNFLKQQEILGQVIVISDDQELLNYTLTLGFRNVFKEEHNSSDSEYESIYKCINLLNIKCDWFILFPVCQPLKSSNLILDCIRKINDNYDFITSYNIVADRTIFLIDENNNFLVNSEERKGSLCKQTKMIDGSIYCVKMAFIKKCIESGNINKTFWAGKFDTVKNDSLFFDIDTPEDMLQLDNAIEFVKNNC